MKETLENGRVNTHTIQRGTGRSPIGDGVFLKNPRPQPSPKKGNQINGKELRQ